VTAHTTVFLYHPLYSAGVLGVFTFLAGDYPISVTKGTLLLDSPYGASIRCSASEILTCHDAYSPNRSAHALQLMSRRGKALSLNLNFEQHVLCALFLFFEKAKLALLTP